MQLRKTNLLLAAVFATSLVLTACGDEAGGENLSCNEDGDCADTEICSAGYCMQTCDTAADCPDTNKNCAASTGSTQKICRCSTDELCNGGDAEGTLTCTASGACTSDAGPGPGPTTCTGTGQAGCAYGSECVSGTCTALTTGTCSNITNATEPTSQYKPSTWTPSISNKGPVIYNVSQVSYATDTTFCSSGFRAVAKIEAYANTGFTFPTAKEGLGNFFYAQVDGDTLAVQTTSNPNGVGVTSYQQTGGGTGATFNINLCTATNSLQIGVFFVNGNGYCTNLTR